MREEEFFNSLLEVGLLDYQRPSRGGGYPVFGAQMDRFIPGVGVKTSRIKDSDVKQWIQCTASFRYESDLVSTLCNGLSVLDRSVGTTVSFILEADFGMGRPDILAVTQDEDVLTIEGKLIKWQIALQQAIRNLSVSHYSHVALPLRTAARIYASERISNFQKRGVGLLGVSATLTVLFLPASYRFPTLPSMSRKLAARTVSE